MGSAILECGGWAVIDEDGINIKTVSDTRRAAIVNWLCVKWGLLATTLTTDAAIERAWKARSGDGEAKALEVSVYASP